MAAVEPEPESAARESLEAQAPVPGREPASEPKLATERDPDAAEAAEAEEDEGEEAEESEGQARAPWHFKVIVIGSIGYLGWRAYQGISWLAHHIH